MTFIAIRTTAALTGFRLRPGLGRSKTRRASAAAGMLSAAVLLAPGCGQADWKGQASVEEPVRRAAFRAMIAHDFVGSCPGSEARVESRRQAERHTELKQLGARKGAGHALWLGENDHAGLAPHGDREHCLPGEEAYRAALAGYGASLDALAGRIAEYRP